MRLRRFVVVVSAPLAAALPANARATGALTLGFNVGAQPSLSRAAAEGAGLMRVSLPWAAVAPVKRPRGFVASDPTSPGYRWSSVDALVRAVTDRGMDVVLGVSTAPDWAEGPHPPRNAVAGTWEPNPTQLAKFARAAARRYDGTFPNPDNPGGVLPPVRYWQVWNEPNLEIDLAPQWHRTRGGGYAPASPVIYRRMLNAFYGAVKGVSRSNFVVTAGMAPYGDPPGVRLPGLGFRMMPVAFDRVLFSAPVHLDAIAQNVYSIYAPAWHAVNSDDVAVPDVYKVGRVLDAAERTGHALPRGPKSLWVTELGWDSKPPNPAGVPVAEQARWYEQAFYMFWRQRVDTVLLLQVIDSPPNPSYFLASEAGVYYVDGRPKPAATAFRFPFVTTRTGPSAVQAWGRAPVGGQLVLEQLTGRRWRAVAGLTVRPRQVFERMLALRGRVLLRAKVSGQTSLVWVQAP